MTGTKRRHAALLLLALATVSGAAEAVEQRAELGTRLRYAAVRDGDTNGAAASLLLRLSLHSEWNANTRTYIEFDHVGSALKNQHSDGVRFNGKPSVVDVPSAEINQAFVATGLANWDVRLGRQAIEFDDQRMVGSADFWQNEQTFDAVFAQRQWLSASRINYAYIANANRIFGDRADGSLSPSDVNYGYRNGERPEGLLGDHRQQTHLARVEFNEWDFSRLVGYAYLIDNSSAPSFSSETAGVSYSVAGKRGPFALRAAAELARQRRTEVGGSPRANYHKLEAGIGYRSLELALRDERVGSDNDVPFIAPLGSLHEFHGWADVFTTPPTGGLADRVLKLKWRQAPWKFDGRYHRFREAGEGYALGEEFDFDVILKLRRKHTLMLRYADFHADAASLLDDVRRVYLSYSYNL